MVVYCSTVEHTLLQFRKFAFLSWWDQTLIICGWNIKLLYTIWFHKWGVEVWQASPSNWQSKKDVGGHTRILLELYSHQKVPHLSGWLWYIVYNLQDQPLGRAPVSVFGQTSFFEQSICLSACSSVLTCQLEVSMYIHSECCRYIWTVNCGCELNTRILSWCFYCLCVFLMIMLVGVMSVQFL